MRELTFAGFLKQYVRSLSVSNTTGLYKLAAEAAYENPRLREPLFLYAVFSSKEQVLLKATKLPELRIVYTSLLEQYDRAKLELALHDGDFPLPDYAKVYTSYISVKNSRQRDNNTKMLMRRRIVELQKLKKISAYRLYTDLGLNHGNVNSFLKHGDYSKLSLRAAQSALIYLENAPVPC